MSNRLKKQRGFTLVEALAAFAILAMIMSKLLSGINGGVRNEARSDFLYRASRDGSSQLDALGITGSMKLGVSRGTYEDGLQWQLTITPGASLTQPDGRTLVSAYKVILDILRPSGYGDAFSLSTTKVIFTEANQQ